MAFPHIKRDTPNGSFTKCYPCSRFIPLPIFPVAPPRLAIPPRGGVAMQMHHRKHENSRSLDTVEKAVRELARDGSSNAAVNDLML